MVTDNSVYNRENGTIKKVEIINFMCHEHLTVDFSPDITFITGPNGSGKSAILTALQVAFGIHANSTGRATKLDQLIRKGSSSPAKVCVHIRNVGMYAYQPNEYGDTIIVERIIRPSSNIIRLLNKEGRVITERKRDVLEMLKHFNIKIDNPLVFMEQTTMKQFIQGDEKVKYGVLMQAMNFTSLEQNFNQTESNLSNMQDMLSRFKQVELLKKKTEREAAGEELRKIKRLEDRQHQTQELQKRILWAEVQEIEAKIDSIQKDINHIGESIETFNARIRTEEEASSKLQEEMNSANSKIDSLANELKLLQEESSRCNEEREAAIAPVHQAREEEREARRNINKYRRQIQINRDAMDSISKKMEEKAKDVSKKQLIESLNAERAALEKRKEDLQNVVNENEQRKQALTNELERLRSVELSLSSEKNLLDRDIRRIRMSLEDASRAQKDRRFRYGQKMVNLLNELSRYRSDYPIYCPVGEYVTLKDQFRPWSNAIETSLDNALCGAVCCVNSNRDIQFITQLGKKYGVYSFNVIAVSYAGDFNLPSVGYNTILDAFEYKSPVIKKALIMTSGIESTVLAHDVNDVLSITGNGNERSLPRNCKKILTENGDTHRVRNGKPNMSANRKKALGLLETNSVTMTQQLEAELREKKMQFNVLCDRIRDMSKQCSDLEREKSAVDREYTSSAGKIVEFERDIQRIQNKLDRIAAEDDEGQLESLRFEMEELSKGITIAEESQRNEELKVEELEARIRSGEEIAKVAEQKVAEMRRKVEETSMRLENLRDSKELNRKISRSELVIRMAKDSIKKLEDEREVKYQERNQNQEIVDASVAKLGPENRITEELSKHACEVEYKRMNEELQQEMAELGIASIEAVENKWNQANEAYKKSENEYKSVKREGQQMDDLNKRQRLSYSELRNEAQQQICKRFTMFLSQRKAEGKVTINHSSKEVNLAVKMDSTNEIAQSQVSNIRVLSGGEKSFVTLSLIMATAHIVESPFFIMDEFDVFMDEANRVVSLHTIIDTARQEKKQFIFITPHNLETVVKEMGKEGRKDIDIFRLSDHQSSRNSYSVCCNILIFSLRATTDFYIIILIRSVFVLNCFDNDNRLLTAIRNAITQHPSEWYII